MTFLDRFRPVTRTCRARYGRMTYFRQDEWHGRSFAEYGEWSESEVALWRSFIFKGDVVVDVGAHIGAHTLALSELVGPFGKVYAFEPQREVWQVLRQNVMQNRSAGNTSVFQVALGDGTQGVMRYDAQDFRKKGNFGGVELRNMEGGDTGHLTDVHALDKFLIDWQVQPDRVDFIKIDVEGMERAVLKGAERLIRRWHPRLYVENDRPDKSAALLSFLQGLGYSVRWHLAPLWNQDNFRGSIRNIFGNTMSVNLLAESRTSEPTENPHLRAQSAVAITSSGQVIYRG